MLLPLNLVIVCLAPVHSPMVDFCCFHEFGELQVYTAKLGIDSGAIVLCHIPPVPSPNGEDQTWFPYVCGRSPRPVVVFKLGFRARATSVVRTVSVRVHLVPEPSGADQTWFPSFRARWC